MFQNATLQNSLLAKAPSQEKIFSASISVQYGMVGNSYHRPSVAVGYLCLVDDITSYSTS